MQPGSSTAEKNNAVREAGTLRIENEDLKDKLEEAGRKLDEVQNTVILTFFIQEVRYTKVLLVLLRAFISVSMGHKPIFDLDINRGGKRIGGTGAVTLASEKLSTIRAMRREEINTSRVKTFRFTSPFLVAVNFFAPGIRDNSGNGNGSWLHQYHQPS